MCDMHCEQDFILTMEMIRVEFKFSFPKEIFKLIMTLYLLIYIMIVGNIPFAQRLNGGKEILTLFVLMVGYISVAVYKMVELWQIMNIKDKDEFRSQATRTLYVFFSVALQIAFIFFYAITGKEPLISLALAVSIIIPVVTLCAQSCICHYNLFSLDLKQESCLYLGNSLIGIVRHLWMAAIIFWIYYGAMNNDKIRVELKHAYFAVTVRTVGASFLGIYTIYLFIGLFPLCFSSEIKKQKHICWLIINRVITFCEYLFLGVYFVSSSPTAFILFAILIVAKFITSCLFLKTKDPNNPNKQLGSVVPQSPRPTEGDDNEQNANGGLRTDRTIGHLPPKYLHTN